MDEAGHQRVQLLRKGIVENSQFFSQFHVTSYDKWVEYVKDDKAYSELVILLGEVEAERVLECCFQLYWRKWR